MKQFFSVTGMGCSACQSAVEKAVAAINGVANVSVNLIDNSMTVLYDETLVTPDTVIDAVKKAGYGASLVGDTPDSDSLSVGKKKASLRERLLSNIVLKNFVVSCALLVPLIYLNLAGMFSWAHPMNLSPYIQMILAIAILIINKEYFVRSFKGFKSKTYGMDTLVAVSSSLTYIYSIYRVTANIVISKRFLFTDWFNMRYASSMGNAPECMYFFEASAMVVTLITLGKALESATKARTMIAVKNLISLSPGEAYVEKENAEVVVKVSDIEIGDTVLVRMGDRVPVDGTVIFGTASFDTSMLTGESVLKDLGEGMQVVAGSLCLDGFVKVKAQKVGTDTTLSQMIEIVKNAGAGKAPIQRRVDRVSAIFVPIILTISMITFLAWIFMGYGIAFSLNMAVSVMVISCPCALGLATPTAIMAGTGNAAANGILTREASCLETARNTTYVLLDKTGTLTEGNLSVTDVYVTDDTDEKDFIFKAAVLETVSTHPYAKAIRMHALKFFTAFELMEERAFGAKTIKGGISAIIGVRTWCAGNEELMVDRGIDVSALKEKAEELKGCGKTVIWIADKTLRGIMAISDSVKASSKEAVACMKESGLKVAMITGDNAVTAQKIAGELGIENVFSEVLPADKHAIVEKLKGEGEIVAMIGDGVNDAAALTVADTGISLGSGTDIAIDSSDFILMRNSVKDACYIFSLSKRVMKTIRQNLFWAFVYNVIAIPIAAGALYVPFGLKLAPGISVACMSVSSLFVVLNALRLNKRSPNNDIL